MASPPLSPLGEVSVESDAPEMSPHCLPVILQPSRRRHHQHSKPTKFFRTVRSSFRTLPILIPAGCRFPAPISLRCGAGLRDGHVHGATRTTGTLFGHRKSRITIAFQDSPRSVPLLLLNLAIPTAKFMQDLGSSGLVRVALECERCGAGHRRVLDEPAWSAFVNGRNIGYAARRDPAELDLNMMQLLGAVSMGAGLLPGDMSDEVNGELMYMRSYFDRVVGSKNSETFYMLNPNGNVGPELTVFFVRI